MININIFLSTLADVYEEHNIAVDIIQTFNRNRWLLDKLRFEVVDPDSFDQAKDQTYNSPVPLRDCEIVYFILWSRLKLPSPDTSCKSATEWELQIALQSAKSSVPRHIVIFRRNEPVFISLADTLLEERVEQWKSVKAFFSSIAVSCIDYNTPEDFRKLLLDDLQQFIENRLAATSLPALPPPAITLAQQPSPFPGLRSFTPEESAYFFGRGAETKELLRIVAGSETHSVAVVGDSGSGKSSLVLAGLLPRLMANTTLGSANWLPILFKPADLLNPVDTLAAAMLKNVPGAPNNGKNVEALAAQLSDEKTWLRLIEQVQSQKPNCHRLLLVIDQFEQAFTLAGTKASDAFINAITAALHSGCASMILTIRIDFFQRCFDWPGFGSLLSPIVYFLQPPDATALGDMIERPAIYEGLRFDEDLIPLILQETGTKPGVLPLLACTLEKLYAKRRQSLRLTVDDYQAIGRVQGVLRKLTDEVFSKLNSPTATEAVFIELTRVDSAGNLVIKPTLKDQVMSIPGGDTVVNAFVDAKLVSVRFSQELNGNVVEIAHDAVLEFWITNTHQFEEVSRFHLWRTGLDEQLALWKKNGSKPDHLLRGAAVEEARQRLQTWGTFIDSAQRHYIEESVIRSRSENRRNVVLTATVVFLTLIISGGIIATGWMFDNSVGIFASDGAWQPVSSIKTALQLVSDPQNPNVLYMSSDFESKDSPSSLYRSENRGNNFELLVALPAPFSIQTIAFSPRQPDQIFLGTIAPSQNNQDSYGAVFSFNTKTMVLSDPVSVSDSQVITRIVVDPLDDQIIYASDPFSQALFISKNGGHNWTRLSVCGSVAEKITSCNVFSFTAGTLEDRLTILFAGGADGTIWQSVDNGDKWQPLVLDRMQDMQDAVIDIRMRDANHIILLTKAGDLNLVTFQGTKGNLKTLIREIPDGTIVPDPSTPNIVFVNANLKGVYLVKFPSEGTDADLRQIAPGNGFPKNSTSYALAVSGDYQGDYVYAVVEEGILGWKPSRGISHWFTHAPN